MCEYANFISRQCLMLYDSISKFVYYVPVTMPGDSSIQRQLSYRDNAPLIGPLNDPDGWETLDPVIVEGTLFRRRTVQMQYQVRRYVAYHHRISCSYLYVSYLWRNRYVIDLR